MEAGILSIVVERLDADNIDEDIELRVLAVHQQGRGGCRRPRERRRRTPPGCYGWLVESSTTARPKHAACGHAQRRCVDARRSKPRCRSGSLSWPTTRAATAPFACRLTTLTSASSSASPGPR